MNGERGWNISINLDIKVIPNIQYLMINLNYEEWVLGD